MKYRPNVVSTADGRSVMILTDENGDSQMVTDGHPNYLRIFEALHKGEDPGVLLDPTHVPEPRAAEIHTLSDRVTVIDDVLHFDGEPVHSVLADTILRYRRDDMDPYNIVRFMERLSANPSEASREALFTWAQAKDLTIDPNGFLICYKGVTHDMLSLHSGKARVNGVLVEGQIPNVIGSVVAMPRSDVDGDTNVGCSSGLHVGSWSYASSFGPVTLEVRVDPANVVSVPRDCGYQKMRVCEYEVVAVHDTDKGDDLSNYEPESGDDAWNAFAEAELPTGILASLRERIRRNRRKNKDEEI